jgi:hypothetical protein
MAGDFRPRFSSCIWPKFSVIPHCTVSYTVESKLLQIFLEDTRCNCKRALWVGFAMSS